MVQGQIEINLRGLCKGRGIIQRAELQGVTSWPINVGLITPRAVMDTSGACARLSSPPASSPAPPLRSMYLELNEETEKESRHGDEKNRRDDYQPIRKTDRSKVFCSQTPGVSLHFRSWPAYVSGANTRIFSDRRANVQMVVESWNKYIYIYIYIYRNIETFFSLLE